MITVAHDVTRFSSILFVKGCLMCVAGATALLWADQTLVYAMLITGLLLGLSGLYETVVALQLRTVTRGWPIALADGAASVGLAFLTMTVAVIPLRATMLLTAVWLGLYGVLCGAVAFAVWPMPRTRGALLGWSAVDLLLAVSAMAYARINIFTLLYAGAAYAIAFGLFQLAAGLWIRRVAASEIAPIRQARWTVAAHPSR